MSVPAAQRIEEALAAAAAPLSVDELARAVFGRLGESERSAVRLQLHRLDAAGRLEKSPRKYRLIVGSSE